MRGLRACSRPSPARRVSTTSSSFHEPIAAAWHYEQTVQAEELVLIADIGGGTSDFSVVRIGPQRRGRIDRTGDILATAGVRIGGTDFDSALSLAAVMPLLGLGTRLVEKDLPMPNALYHELANWATINFAYTYKNERELGALVLEACEPEKVGRLLAVMRQAPRPPRRLRGRGRQDRAQRRATMPPYPSTSSSTGLAAAATRGGFERAIRTRTDRLYRTARDCIAAAGLDGAAIDTVFLTGGSSRVPAVRAAIAKAAPGARLATGSDLLSVASGLTQMAGRLK